MKTKRCKKHAIQRKVFMLSLVTILLLAGGFLAVANHLGNIIIRLNDESSLRQRTVISEITDEAMTGMANQDLARANATEASFADELFEQAKENVSFIAEYVTKILSDPEEYSPWPYAEPDLADEGKWTAKVLYASGTDPDDPALAEKLGFLANLTNPMISLCVNYDVEDIYIGLPEGAHFTVNRTSAGWFVDGKPEFDPRSRIWYRKAVQSGGLIFTDGELDSETDRFCVECAMPIYDAAGGLLAVIGQDLYLDEIEQVLRNASVEGEFTLLVGRDGKSLLPTLAESFPMPAADRTGDLRISQNAWLSGVVANALEGRNVEVTLGHLEDGDYYMVAMPIPTTGWVLVSAYSQAVINAPLDRLERRLAVVQDETIEELNSSVGGAQTTALVLLIAVVLLALGWAAALGWRIVRPLNIMTRRISEGSGGDLSFTMEDAYRTGDEVQRLAESFEALSRRTAAYMQELVAATAEKERIGAELSLATRIQTDMLPHDFPAFPERGEFDIFASMDPAKEVGGDFYDFFLVDEDHLCMVIADASGKGIPAAMYTMTARSIIASNAMMGKSPAQVLCDSNMTLCANGQEDMFVTVWVGILELSTGRLTTANGGHEYPALMSEGRFALHRDVHGFLLGGMPGARYRDYEILLNPGDKVFVYTDGITEAQDVQRKLFGRDRLVDTLNGCRPGSPEEVVKHVRKDVDTFVGTAEQFDDMTMLCVVYKGKNG